VGALGKCFRKFYCERGLAEAEAGTSMIRLISVHSRIPDGTSPSLSRKTGSSRLRTLLGGANGAGPPATGAGFPKYPANRYRLLIASLAGRHAFSLTLVPYSQFTSLRVAPNYTIIGLGYCIWYAVGRHFGMTKNSSAEREHFWSIVWMFGVIGLFFLLAYLSWLLWRFI
jgi:hypothetical protein